MANSIRANIPKSKQTDPAFFPDYEFREFPKMMTDEHGEPLVNNPIYQTDEHGKTVYRTVTVNGQQIKRPHLIGGEFVVVANAEEEAEFLKLHPECAKKITVEVRPNVTADLEAENARLRALLAEHDKLEKQIAEAEKPKRGRPGKEKAPAAEKRITLDEFAAAK